MTPRNALLVLVSAGLLTWGCGQAEQSSGLPADEYARMPPPAAADPEAAGMQERMIRGELKEVDLVAKTFVLVGHDDVERAFTFSDATEILGASTVQGLAGREGAHVTVHFREDGPVRMALTIELE